MESAKGDTISELADELQHRGEGVLWLIGCDNELSVIASEFLQVSYVAVAFGFERFCDVVNGGGNVLEVVDRVGVRGRN